VEVSTGNGERFAGIGLGLIEFGLSEPSFKLGFNRAFTGFCWVSYCFPFPISLGFTNFSSGFTGFDWVGQGFGGI